MIEWSYLAIWAIICCILVVLWHRTLGWVRALLAGLARFFWVLPLILSLAPETIVEKVPSHVAQRPINILVDDSASMRSPGRRGDLKDEVTGIAKIIDDVCARSGCLPKITRLSEVRPETKKGFTPLSAGLESWFFKSGSDPWIILTDGGDWRPSRAWDEKFNGRGLAKNSGHSDAPAQGLILGFGVPYSPGFWIDSIDVPSYAFEGRSTEVTATIGRAQMDRVETCQVQVVIDGKLLVTQDAVFGQNSKTASVSLHFQPESRGTHLVSLKVLPVKGEKDKWDNEVTTTINVMPNTIGVLHLLGGPSWDGRFLRRYLKAEPKYDLISFFILRDKWDMQDVSEREMSLIAFPVERLFSEELSNFRTIVLQDFSMNQFLDQNYQANLVKFVKEGGGLLFVGGPHALTELDFMRSPMSELFPFKWNEVVSKPTQQKLGFLSQEGAVSYDDELEFKIEMAKPDERKRSLASVYDGWERLSERLVQVPKIKGMHRLKLDENLSGREVTPLLTARLNNGETAPLALASYPGKGRAIWLLSDQLWRLRGSGDSSGSRFDYQSFFDEALTWLVRSDRKPALLMSQFNVDREKESDALSFSFRLSGPASRYFNSKSADWQLNVCGELIAGSKINADQIARDEWIVSGKSSAQLRPGAICMATLSSVNEAFGRAQADSATVLAPLISDADMSPSPRKLRELATLTGADYVETEFEHGQKVTAWLQKWTAASQFEQAIKTRTLRDFYWVMNRNWIWIILLMLPFEVLIRRWHLIIGRAIDRSHQLETD